MPFDHAVPDVEALRELYRQPHPLVLRKQIHHIDDAARSFIEASPFVVVATIGPAGTDASPRGGAPGFVAVLDAGRLAMGDLSGNNRLDTHTNLLAEPEVGLIFFVPGVEETLRVNGRATLTTDPDVLDAVVVDGLPAPRYRHRRRGVLHPLREGVPSFGAVGPRDLARTRGPPVGNPRTARPHRSRGLARGHRGRPRGWVRGDPVGTRRLRTTAADAT